ncbi:MAG: family 1 glycosylhydrolase [Propionibacteriaceae bacterium]|jgi:beta-glucosidase|nr:family 1 glycosylhydrolase [Propionibacteriaceae bacterium]
MTLFPPGFSWGASTSAHQIEGGNVASDWWYLEHAPGTFVTEPSGDACDSYHRWREDLALLAGAGFNAYRFSIEWARIEPAPGAFSMAQLDHYRTMIETALELGLRPLVTLHHFTNPAWLGAMGGWAHPDAPKLFARYAATVAPILAGVEHVCLINEPNMVALFPVLQQGGVAALGKELPAIDQASAQGLIAGHDAARAVLRDALPDARLGWSVAAQTYHPAPGAEELAAVYQAESEDLFYTASAGDDWIGVQAYTCRRVKAEDGALLPDPRWDAKRTITGWEYYPAALAECVRRVHAFTGLPIIVTENGIATADDTERIAYTQAALDGLAEAMKDGVDVRGYFHWSLLDNYEWGSFDPTFGLVAVDRQTFVRTPKPSLAWLGGLAPENHLDPAISPSTPPETTNPIASSTAERN